MRDTNAFLIYQDDNGVSNVNVRFEGEDVWLAVEQIQELSQASRQDVAYHIDRSTVTVNLCAGNLQKVFASSTRGYAERQTPVCALQP